MAKTKYSKEQILQTSLNLLRTRGIESITSREIAKQLNCSVIPIFTYYQNMEYLKEDLTKKAYEIYAEYIAIGESEKIKFKGAGLAYIRLAKEEPQIFKLLFMSNNPLKARVQSDFCTNDEVSKNILELVQENTNLSAKNAKKLYFYNWLFVHSIACMVATGFCEFTSEEISEMVSFEYASLLDRFRKIEAEESVENGIK